MLAVRLASRRCIRTVRTPSLVRMETTVQTPTKTETLSERQLLKYVKELSMEDAAKNVDLSPEVEAELNKEFAEVIRKFALEPDLRKEMLRVFERTAAQGARSARIETSEKEAADGNIRGRQQFPNIQRSDPTDVYSSQELFARQKFHEQQTSRLGASVEQVYRPHEDVLRPPSARETTIAKLLAAGAHLGHSTSRFRQSTQPFVYGIRDGIHIIDLDQTLTHLRRAAKVCEGISEKGGLILFVGTRKGHERTLQVAAERANAFYVHTRWVPGTLSNATEISGEWDRVEVDMADRPTDRELSQNLKKTIVKPDLVVILNPVENRNAIRECIAAKVPTIAVIDTDSEPSLVTYPIPANDDSLRATDLIAGVLSRAAQKGRETRLRKVKEFEAKNAQQQEQLGKPEAEPTDV